MSPTIEDIDKRLAKLEILAAKLIHIGQRLPVGRAVLKMIHAEDILDGSTES